MVAGRLAQPVPPRGGPGREWPAPSHDAAVNGGWNAKAGVGCADDYLAPISRSRSRSRFRWLERSPVSTSRGVVEDRAPLIGAVSSPLPGSRAVGAAARRPRREHAASGHVRRGSHDGGAHAAPCPARLCTGTGSAHGARGTRGSHGLGAHLGLDRAWPSVHAATASEVAAAAGLCPATLKGCATVSQQLYVWVRGARAGRAPACCRAPSPAAATCTRAGPRLVGHAPSSPHAAAPSAGCCKGGPGRRRDEARQGERRARRGEGRRDV